MMRTTSEQHPAFRVDNLTHNTQGDLLLPEYPDSIREGHDQYRKLQVTDAKMILMFVLTLNKCCIYYLNNYMY